MTSKKQSRRMAARASREQEMRHLVLDQERGGLSQREFCEVHGVPLSTLSWWRKKLGRGCGRKTGRSAGHAKVGFLEVQVVDDTLAAETASTADPVIEICLPGGAVIRISQEANETTLRRVLNVVGVSC